LAPNAAPAFASRIHHVEGKALISINTLRHSSRHRIKPEPVTVGFPMIVDRPIRQRIAVDLNWAAAYRQDAVTAHRNRNLRLKQVYVRAARECIKDARALITPFARLPG
jgi:hypothetical protein